MRWTKIWLAKNWPTTAPTSSLWHNSSINKGSFTWWANYEICVLRLSRLKIFSFRKIDAGGRPEPDVFQDFHEEVQGILATLDPSLCAAFESSASRHALPTTSNATADIAREKSVESVGFFPENDLKTSGKKSRHNKNKVLPVVIHKDVENVLTLVQVESILNRVASGRPIEK